MAEAAVDFVIVGAQRAASTSLTTALSGHPEVFLCPDEVPIFEDPFYATTPLTALDDVFAGASPGQRRGIRRPDYLGRPECPGHIHEAAPEARILAVLRDPVGRAVSAYHWYVQFGLLPLVPLDEGMRRLLDGWTDAAHPRAGEVLEFGFYGRQLTRYVELFGSGQVLVLLTEDLRSPSGLAGTYSFLGVDPHHRTQPVEKADNAGVYDLRRLRVLRARRRFAWSWDDVQVYEYRRRRWRRPLRFIPTAAVVGLDRVVLARVFGNPRPQVEPALEARLRALYRDDIAVLERLVTRDLSAWRR